MKATRGGEGIGSRERCCRLATDGVSGMWTSPAETTQRTAATTELSRSPDSLPQARRQPSRTRRLEDQPLRPEGRRRRLRRCSCSPNARPRLTLSLAAEHLEREPVGESALDASANQSRVSESTRSRRRPRRARPAGVRRRAIKGRRPPSRRLSRRRRRGRRGLRRSRGRRSSKPSVLTRAQDGPHRSARRAREACPWPGCRCWRHHDLARQRGAERGKHLLRRLSRAPSTLRAGTESQPTPYREPEAKDAYTTSCRWSPTSLRACVRCSSPITAFEGPFRRV